MKTHSWLGFCGSLLFHAGLCAALLFAFQQDDQAGSPAENIDTNISMQMMMATVVETPQPVVEKQPEPEPEKKEEVADPTLKPEPQKIKQPEPKKEPPKEKPKPKKEKPKEVKKAQKSVEPMKDAVKADKVTEGGEVNSQASSIKSVTTNPNLAGSGSSSSEISAYQSALRREIERHKKYSQRAKMMRKQGVVTIVFNLAADGSISGARVAKSSGTEDLDNSALQAVQSARSIGPRPAGMSASFSVPIQFKIQ